MCAKSFQPTLSNPMDCSPPGSSVYGDSSGKNTGVGCYALLQGIFPTQRSNPGLPHCRRILYSLSHQGSPSFIPTLYLPFMIWRLAISVTYEMRDVYNWKVYPRLIIWRLPICAWVLFPALLGASYYDKVLKCAFHKHYHVIFQQEKCLNFCLCFSEWNV